MTESVVFFGTGPVAARSLELLSEYCSIEAVITKPKPAHHQGSFPVLETARKLGLATYTVSSRSELSKLIATKPFVSTLGILIDFGIIVSQDVIDYFPLGIVNSHFSLLPEWRGADPITFAVLSGQKETGISLMLLTAGMDEGPILAHTPYEMPPHITTPELTDELIKVSNKSLKNILPMYLADKVRPAAQESVTMPNHRESYSRKLTKEDGIIDWRKPAEVIEREIRAFIDWPKSRTTLGGKDIIITKAHAVPSRPSDAQPGDIDVVEQIKEFGVVADNGTLWIDNLKPAGKKEMTAAAFLAGYGHLLQKHT